jgi:transcriptional regulator with XRE-family HTH domain
MQFIEDDTLSYRVKKVRKSLKFTQKQLGEAICDTPNYEKRISHIESGFIKNLTPAEVQNIVTQFNINANWLLNGEGEMHELDSKNFVPLPKQLPKNSSLEFDTLRQRISELEAIIADKNLIIQLLQKNKSCK